MKSPKTLQGAKCVNTSTSYTTNMYELSATGYKKLLKDNITKTYKKATPRLKDIINLEAK